jgi:hypothetical protein
MGSASMPIVGQTAARQSRVRACNGRRKCKGCHKLFRPDPRNRYYQRYLRGPELSRREQSRQQGSLARRSVVIVGLIRRHRGRACASRSDVEILLIDRRNHHILQPLLYQVATAVLAPSEIAAPIRQLEVKQKNLSVLLAEV